MDLASIRFIDCRKLLELSEKYPDICECCRLQLTRPLHHQIVRFERPLYGLTFHCQLIQIARPIEILYGQDVGRIAVLLQVAPLTELFEGAFDFGEIHAIKYSLVYL